MQLCVKEMPENAKECIFSEWKPFPPLIQKPGYYKCKIENEPCSLRNKKCRHLCSLTDE